ncbi:nitrate- and nitrite sensing domain-containing protein [Nocardia tengchongensis]|uniref:nitrate- and nitrite sensing domain-containing protein n=1 Tax=Nocardia tengchongensis TaxID=2055889 RepID=UPI0036AA587E
MSIAIPHKRTRAAGPSAARLRCGDASSEARGPDPDPGHRAGPEHGVDPQLTTARQRLDTAVRLLAPAQSELSRNGPDAMGQATDALGETSKHLAVIRSGIDAGTVSVADAYSFYNRTPQGDVNTSVWSAITARGSATSSTRPTSSRPRSRTPWSRAPPGNVWARWSPSWPSARSPRRRARPNGPHRNRFRSRRPSGSAAPTRSLAARHDISVRLSDSDHGGVRAIVLFPARLIERGTSGDPTVAGPDSALAADSRNRP